MLLHILANGKFQEATENNIIDENQPPIIINRHYLLEEGIRAIYDPKVLENHRCFLDTAQSRSAKNSRMFSAAYEREYTLSGSLSLQDCGEGESCMSMLLAGGPSAATANGCNIQQTAKEAAEIFEYSMRYDYGHPVDKFGSYIIKIMFEKIFASYVHAVSMDATEPYTENTLMMGIFTGPDEVVNTTKDPIQRPLGDSVYLSGKFGDSKKSLSRNGSNAKNSNKILRETLLEAHDLCTRDRKEYEASLGSKSKKNAETLAQWWMPCNGVDSEGLPGFTTTVDGKKELKCQAYFTEKHQARVLPIAEDLGIGQESAGLRQYTGVRYLRIGYPSVGSSNSKMESNLNISDYDKKHEHLCAREIMNASDGSTVASVLQKVASTYKKIVNGGNAVHALPVRQSRAAVIEQVAAKAMYHQLYKTSKLIWNRSEKSVRFKIQEFLGVFFRSDNARRSEVEKIMQEWDVDRGSRCRRN